MHARVFRPHQLSIGAILVVVALAKPAAAAQEVDATRPERRVIARALGLVPDGHRLSVRVIDRSLGSRAEGRASSELLRPHDDLRGPPDAPGDSCAH